LSNGSYLILFYILNHMGSLKVMGYCGGKFLMLFYILVEPLEVEGRVWESGGCGSLCERIGSSIVLFLSFISCKLKISRIKSTEGRVCSVKYERGTQHSLGTDNIKRREIRRISKNLGAFLKATRNKMCFGDC
jgi:hypothetical protein